MYKKKNKKPWLESEMRKKEVEKYILQKKSPKEIKELMGLSIQRVYQIINEIKVEWKDLLKPEEIENLKSARLIEIRFMMDVLMKQALEEISNIPTYKIQMWTQLAKREAELLGMDAPTKIETRIIPDYIDFDDEDGE